jgi:meso-butanediol dehydrogenase/(S,S)-butanediol dehydrogenase/diacetyl reductase
METGGARRFEGSCVLVTGGASGIGRATALRLAAEGAKVVAADLDAEGVEETCRRAAAAGAEIAPQSLDVSSPAACRAAVNAVLRRHGRLDVLCNIAGVMSVGRVTDITEEAWNRVLAVNLSGVFFMSQAAIPALLESRGVIVNMASAAGLVGQAYTAPYCATKAAVVSLTRCMALEYGKQGLRVNALCPGGVLTPMTRGFQLPEGADPDMMRKLMPLVPPARPEEIAAAVAYLASPEARYVTGAVLAIDGGQTAG